MSYLTTTYAKMAADLNPTEEYFDTDSRFMTLELLLRTIPSGRFCDMGCGRGALIKRLRDHHDVCGCDYEESAVEACRAEGLVARLVDLNNVDRLPFDGRFDIIVISEVCEHLLDPKNAIRIARKSLLPKGILVVTVPNAVPLFVRLAVPLGRTVGWLHYPSRDTVDTGHIRFYTIRSMSRLLKEEGFQVVDVRGLSFRMNGYFWARLCFWAARIAMRKSKRAPTQIDAWLGKRMPGISPGLLFVGRPA